MIRLLRLFLLLCLVSVQAMPLTWAASSAGEATVHTDVDRMATAPMACCGDDASMPCSPCAVGACAAQCVSLGLLSLAAPVLPLDGHAVLAASAGPAPKSAPVFREERPPRPPV